MIIPGLLLATVFLFTTPDASVVLDSLTSTSEDSQAEFRGENIDLSAFKKMVFGYTENNREIAGYEIGTGSSCIFFVGGFHGNERGTKELLDRYMQELSKHPEIIPDGQRLLISPLINLDGYYKRDDKLNANEVNLNRNFPTTGWVSRTDEEATSYAGPSPFSESESLAVKAMVESCDPEFFISYHSMGALSVPEYSDQSIALAQWYADQTGYEFFNEWDFAGTATLWFEELTGRPAITIELTNHFQSDWAINKKALMTIASTPVEEFLEKLDSEFPL